MSESDNARPSGEEQEHEAHPDCEMPECVGSPDDDISLIRDPSYNLVKMCGGCIDEGWGIGEVVE